MVQVEKIAIEILQKNNMKLDGLIPLYKKLLTNELTYGIFKYTKNKVDFDIFFDIGDTPYKIGFLVLNNDFQLWIDLSKGFIINPILKPEDFKKLVRILKLKFDPNNKFSTKVFFEDFNSKIPTEFRFVKKDELPKIITSIKDIEDSNKIYYNGQIDWDKINNGNKRQPVNLEKTRLLYPELYLQIKDKNISVRYSDVKNDED